MGPCSIATRVLSPSVSTTQALTTSGDGATPLRPQSVSKYRPLTGQGLMPSRAVSRVWTYGGLENAMPNLSLLSILAVIIAVFYASYSGHSQFKGPVCAVSHAT